MDLASRVGQNIAPQKLPPCDGDWTLYFVMAGVTMRFHGNPDDRSAWSTCR